MKVFFPRNIPSGWLNMSVQIGPLQVSVVQLILLAIGVGLTMAVANAFIGRGASKVIGFMVALPILIIFIVVAFFKYSELRLHEFIAKMIRTNFLDATTKYQVNYTRVDPLNIAIAKAKKTDHEVLIKQKDLILDEEKIERLNVLQEEE